MILSYTAHVGGVTNLNLPKQPPQTLNYSIRAAKVAEGTTVVVPRSKITEFQRSFVFKIF